MSFGENRPRRAYDADRQGRGGDTRRTHLHARAGDGIQHPGCNHYDYAGRDLDMNHLALGTPLTILAPYSAAIKRVPPIENFNIRPDVGRMTAVIAVGRKNYLFAGSDNGGERAAIIYTLIETAKLSGVNPHACPSDAIARIADHPARKLDQLLPWAWSPRSSAAITGRLQ